MSTIEQSILQMAMIPQVRDIAVGYFQDWMFSSDLSKAMYKVINSKANTNLKIDPREMVLDLHGRYKIAEEDCEIAYRLAVEATEREEYNLENYIHHITEFIRDRNIGRGVELIATGGSNSDARLKGQLHLQNGLAFSISTDQFYDFSDEDSIKTAKELDMPAGSRIIKSHFGLFNNSSLYGGMKYGDLIVYAGRPGGGKSTGMVCEGAYTAMQNFQTCHLFLGDMTEHDAFLKYLSYFVGVTTNDIINNGYEKYITPEVIALFRRVRVKAFPADTYDIYQILAKVNQLRHKFKFDSLILDYDLNVKAASESMYDNGGTTYGNLKSYGANKCAVLVGSQTKNAFWDHEIVPLEALAESSKKAHHIDAMMGFGRNKGCRHIGTLNIPKMRRGESEVQSRLHLDYAHTRLREISQDVYEKKLAEHKMEKAAQEAEANGESSGGGNEGYSVKD